MSSDQSSPKTSARVVAVVATCGKERIPLLLQRSLPSIANQSFLCARIVVVSDNDEPILSEETIRSCFPEKDRHKVLLITNERSRHRSGTGPWNTGIRKALDLLGEECWIAILDDDDEWCQYHVQNCLDAVPKQGGEKCQWVASGIIRRSNSSGRFEDHQEPIVRTKPSPKHFFFTNPGIQGSNLFVKCRLFLKAGLFDEALPSTTDRDMCIRLCDVLHQHDAFASTGKYTVVHYADKNISRVSQAGTKAKIEGLKMFYFKYAPRMTEDERRAFKERAKARFGCQDYEFIVMPNANSQAECCLTSWSGDNLTLNRGTAIVWPDAIEHATKQQKQDVIFGMITNNICRLEPLLQDLKVASENKRCCFRAFIVIFVNERNNKLTREVKATLAEKNLRGHVINSSDKCVACILERCKSRYDILAGKMQYPLPICQARTVLQVYIYNITKQLDDVSAVTILDDDKRLPIGWSPIQCNTSDDNESDADSDGEGEAPADIQIGRDLRTPPNPALMSLRTQLVDLIYALDVFYMGGDDRESVIDFCRTFPMFGKLHASNHSGGAKEKFDWYYDFSSSRYDHLEAPAYFDFHDRLLLKPEDDETMLWNDLPKSERIKEALEKCLNMILVGTPLSRDVIPLESGPTSQRGGCMVIPNKCEESFEPLAMEQMVPSVLLSSGKQICTRRSDSLWCKVQSQKSKRIEVNEALQVYHENKFDTVPTPEKMREIMVSEICGAILCRETNDRGDFARKRIIDLKCWLLRVQGLLETLRSRSYFSPLMEQCLVQPLMKCVDSQCWQHDVYQVIEDAMKDRILTFDSKPTDFTRVHIDFIEEEIGTIRFEWRKPRRVENARDLLKQRVGERDYVAVGVGHEGVKFRAGDKAYKVFDEVNKNDLRSDSFCKFDARVVVRVEDAPLIMEMPFIEGRNYRGSHGPELVALLRWMKDENIYHRNFSPDNVIVENGTGKLYLVDLGRDLFLEPCESKHRLEYLAMCRRAFLCFRFGSYANHPDDLEVLKEWMRRSSSQKRDMPELTGFEKFMSAVVASDEISRSTRLAEKLKEHEVTKNILFTRLSRSTYCGKSAQIHQEASDNEILNILSNELRKFVKRTENKESFAVCVEDPFFPAPHETSPAYRRSLSIFRRHIRRLLSQHACTIVEDTVAWVCHARFEDCVEFYLFVIHCEPHSSLLFHDTSAQRQNSLYSM